MSSCANLLINDYISCDIQTCRPELLSEEIAIPTEKRSWRASQKLAHNAKLTVHSV